MGSITRCILRYSVIGGLALGGVALLWPDHFDAGVTHVRARAKHVVELAAKDPIALRRQLEKLADQYPDRIADVRGEIAEVDHQMAEFERDVEIAGRVVALATEDLQELKALVARAEVEASASARQVAIRFEGVRFDVEQAYDEGRRINNVRSTYEDRLEHDRFQLKFLGEQKNRLAEILAKLEDEYGTYESQLWQLDRQIDAIERNDRLIDLTEKQQATLASYERFGKLDNLKQLEAKLAELRARQEAQLQTLEKRGVQRDYEDRAIYELETNDVDHNPFVESEFEMEAVPEDEKAADDSMVWAGPIIVQ